MPGDKIFAQRTGKCRIQYKQRSKMHQIKPGTLTFIAYLFFSISA